MDNTNIKTNLKSNSNSNVNTPNTGTWWENLRPSKRKLIQLYSALLYNAHLRGFIDGEIYQGKAKAVCVPGFNCYSCPGAVGACPLGSIQNALASADHRAGWYVLGIIMIFGLSLGRTICGWLCPLGLIQELLHKIPTPKIKKSRITRALSYLKYVILAVFVVAIPMWYGIKHDLAVPGFCKYICPAGTFEGAIGLLSNPGNAGYFSMLKILFTRKFVIMLIIGLACIFCYRSFCRFICPLGAIYGLFNKLALVSVKVDENRCNSCGACVRNCQMDVRHVGDHECIHCARCISSCSQNALSFKAGTHTIIAPACGCADDRPDSVQKRSQYGRIAWGAALAVLCFALVWFNFLDPSVRKAGAQEAGAQTANGQAAGERRLRMDRQQERRLRMDRQQVRRQMHRIPMREHGADWHCDWRADGRLHGRADRRLFLPPGRSARQSRDHQHVGDLLWSCVQELPIFQDFWLPIRRMYRCSSFMPRIRSKTQRNSCRKRRSLCRARSIRWMIISTIWPEHRLPYCRIRSS